jgi:GNAT superfamily N-acetyltransferase
MAISSCLSWTRWGPTRPHLFIITFWVRQNRGLFSNGQVPVKKVPPDLKAAASETLVLCKDAQGSQPMPIPRPRQADRSARDNSAESQTKEKILDQGEGWKLVQMSEEHLDDVIRVQQKCYTPEYRDERQAYVNRMRLFPEGNVVIMVEEPLSKVSPSSPSSQPSSPPSGSPPFESLHSAKKRKVGSYKLAGYILVQPFFREAVNDMSDTKMIEKWIQERGTQPKAEQDCMYTHEIAIDPAFAGKGLTKPLVSYVEKLAQAQGFKWMTLVSLDSAKSFWSRCGYALKKVLDYGGHSCFYMEKPVPGVATITQNQLM